MYATAEEFKDVFSPSPKPARTSSGHAVDFTSSAKMGRQRASGSGGSNAAQLERMKEAMGNDGSFSKTWSGRGTPSQSKVSDAADASGAPSSSSDAAGPDDEAAKAFAQTWAGASGELQLKELRHREREQPISQGTRDAVIEAVALQLAQHVSGGIEAQASSSWSNAIGEFIEQIVQHTEMANSCIVAALIYIERALQVPGFALASQNWRSVLLAALVLAAKVSDDLSVWNEDFAAAVCEPGVGVVEISRWEVDLLQLIEFNVNVELRRYAMVCFSLQQRYEAAHGQRAHFFTYLMKPFADGDQATMT